MRTKQNAKPYNPYSYMVGSHKDYFEETTDGFRFETLRLYGFQNNQARLRRALNNDEPYLWQVLTKTREIHYFNTYKEAMDFFGNKGYLPKPKRLFDLQIWRGGDES